MQFGRELRYALRLLVRDRVFTSTTIILLSLGIGASTAIYTIVDAVLLQDLPFKDSHQIMWLGRTESRYDHPIPISVPDFIDYAAENHTFEHLAAMDVNQSFIIGGEQGAEQVSGVAVSAQLFDIFSIAPFLGRTFLHEENTAGHTNVAVISHSLWERHFGSSPEVLGRTVKINGQNYTLVGVLGNNQYPRWAELWVPIPLTYEESARSLNHISVVGKLKVNVTMAHAQGDLSAIAAQLAAEHPADKSAGITVIPLHERQVKPYRSLLLFFMMTVGFVLLIASANVSNLLLARAISRQREIALRTALGATRMRIIQQLLTEGILLAMIAGAFGVLLSYLAVRLILALIPVQLPNANNLGIDFHALGFTLTLCLVSGILCGLFPAFQLRRVDLKDAIQKAKSQTASMPGSRFGFRSILISVESALTIILLAGAGLMVTSFVRLLNASPGFNPKNLMTFSLSLPKERYSNETTSQFYQQLSERLAALPGVESVGLANTIPPSGSEEDGPLAPDDGSSGQPGSAVTSIYGRINRDFLTAMQITLLRGRYFSREDCINNSKVAIINNTVRKLLDGEDPVGKHIRLGLDDMKSSWTIIGVVADTRYFGWDQDLVPETYICSAPLSRDMAIVLRTKISMTQVPIEIRKTVAAMDKDLAIVSMETMEQRLVRSHAEKRFNMTLLGLFAAIGLTIAAIGIYAAVSYTVTQRLHEIGIRLALGASRSNIVFLVIRNGMSAVMIGMTAGLIIALMLTRFIKSLLYNVAPTDPLTLTLVSCLLILIALTGCYVPAARAARVNPAVSLRYE